MGSIVLFLSLPVTESIGKDDIACHNSVVRIAFDKLIPRISRSNRDRACSKRLEEGSDFVDLVC